MVRHQTGLNPIVPALLLSLWISADTLTAAETPENLRRENLVAWCIVPFDSEKRNPYQRAEMVENLGLKRVAYDWREQHIQEFEEEIIAYKERDIEFFAFWRGHDEAYDLFKKHDISPQIWRTVPTPRGQSNERLTKVVEELLPLAEKTKQEGLKLGLYNHGGWGGLPENLVATCEALREKGFENVGIVYNFHHAHPRIKQFAGDLRDMLPYLYCVNLNGMLDPKNHDVAKNTNKIRPIASGDHEARMILDLINLGYDGPVGILGHVQSRNVEEVLRENLDGLESVIDRMK